MPDTEFCLGPSKGYDPRIETDDPLAQRETNEGSTIPETFKRSLRFIHLTLQRIHYLLSVRTEQTTATPFSPPTDEEFCCGPSKEWLQEHAEHSSSQEGIYIIPDGQQLIIGHGQLEEDTQISVAV
jgi:hypothetical protein